MLSGPLLVAIERKRVKQYFIWVLRDVEITEADICLAELVKQELFDVIISTNIDTFLEDILKEVEMKEMHDFEILHSELSPQYYALGQALRHPSYQGLW